MRELDALEDRNTIVSASLNDLSDLSVEKDVEVGARKSRLDIRGVCADSLPILDGVRCPP